MPGICGVAIVLFDSLVVSWDWRQIEIRGHRRWSNVFSDDLLWRDVRVQVNHPKLRPVRETPDIPLHHATPAGESSGRLVAGV